MRDRSACERARTVPALPFLSRKSYQQWRRTRHTAERTPPRVTGGRKSITLRREVRVRVPFRFVLALCAIGVLAAAGRAEAPTSWLDDYRAPAARLIGEAMGDSFAWRRLAVLTDSIGNRLSGTPELDRAIRWAVDE